MRYRADPPAERRMVASDGVTLIYHRPSGMTHIVAAPVPEILEALAAGPATTAALLARLPVDWGLGEDAAPALEARLAELVAAGLVAPI